MGCTSTESSSTRQNPSHDDLPTDPRELQSDILLSKHACGILGAHGIATEVMTPTDWVAAIAEDEKAVRDDAALTHACKEALRATGERLPRIPLRAVRGWSPNGTPLPKNWVVMVEGDEVPVIFAMLPAPFVGFVAVIARAVDLPTPMLDDEQLAAALADALLKEVPE